MKRMVPPQDVFIASWNSSETIDDCARECGITRSLAIGYACSLRTRGLPLKKYSGNAIYAKCKHCQKQFRTYPSEVKAGHSQYCSRDCYSHHIGEHTSTHGQSNTRLHGIWCHMKTRCLCETSRVYRYYGGRGITVCQSWIDSFEAFRDWALENGYQDTLELDRRDVNGNYEPDNCRWATRHQQMQNTRKRSNAATSKYKGVSWCANVGRWRVQMHVGGTTVHRGLFDSELEAAKTYDRLAKAEYGEFAHLNFKEE